MKRRVLVILSNRFNRLQPARYLEIDCDSEGNILGQRRLRRPPGRAAYAEVWENDEGKQSLDSCVRMKRHYRHPLLKPR